MKPVTFVVPGDPRGKGRPRFNRAQGRAYSDGRTVNAEGVVKVISMDAMGDTPPFEEAVRVELRAVVPVPGSWSKKKQAAALTGELMPTARPDLDNVVKLILDSIQPRVIKDDKQVIAIAASKEYGPQAMTVVTVSPLRPVEELLS